MLPWLLIGLGVLALVRHFRAPSADELAAGQWRYKYQEPTRSYITAILSHPSKRFVVLRLGPEGGASFTTSFDVYRDAMAYLASHPEAMQPDWTVVDREVW